MPKARLTVWGEAECRRLHEATLELLADTGVDVRYEPGLELFQAAGAHRGRPPRPHPTAPRRRTPWRVRRASGRSSRAAATRRRSILRDGEVYYGTGSDVLYVRDPKSGERRRVRRADVEGMAALCEKLPDIDFIMNMGLPEDAPREIDDLVQVAAMLRGTRKPLLVAPRDGSVLARMQQMAELCGEKESVGIYAMPSPPLMHDPDALTKVIGCAELLIPLIYAPAPNMGATGPRSITGAVLVGNAGDAERPRAAPARQQRSAVRLRRRRRRHGHAHHDRSVCVAGHAARPAGRHRRGSPLRPAELLLRRHVRLQAARRAVERRGRAQHGLRLALAGDARSTTSATSSRACRAATSPSSSATSSWATRVSSCARSRWTTTASRWTRSRPPGPAATISGRSTRAGITGSSGRRPCSTTTSTTAGPPRARRRSAPACARASRRCSPTERPFALTAEQDARLDALLDRGARRPGSAPVASAPGCSGGCSRPTPGRPRGGASPRGVHLVAS